MSPRFFVQDSEGEDEDDDVAAYGSGGGAVTGPEASLGKYAGPVRAGPDVIHQGGPPHHRGLSSSTSISRLSMSSELRRPEANTRHEIQHYQAQAHTLLPQHAPAADNDSVPASLSSQALRHELASAHAAFLKESTTTALPSSTANTALDRTQPSTSYNQEQDGNYQGPELPAIGPIDSTGIAIPSPIGDRNRTNEDDRIGGNRSNVLAPQTPNAHMSAASGGSLINSPSNHPKRTKTTPSNKPATLKKRTATTHGGIEKSRERATAEKSTGGDDVWSFNGNSQDTGTTPARTSLNNNPNAFETTAPNGSKKKKKRQSEAGEDEDFHNMSEGGGSNTKKKPTTKSKRAKTTMSHFDDPNFGEPIVIPDNSDDDDYAPKKSARKAKEKAKTPSMAARAKKTRSNTDHWELMPALPKGRESDVLKQMEAGFAFDRQDAENEARKVAAPRKGSIERVVQEAPAANLSPFKIDLARDSLILHEEEKEQYHTFSPLTTSDSEHTRLNSSAHDAVASDLPPNRPIVGASIHPALISTGMNMSSTIPDEEYFKIVTQKDSTQSSRTGDRQDTPKLAKSLGKRSKTLAQALDLDLTDDDELGSLGGKNTTTRPSKLTPKRAKTSVGLEVNDNSPTTKLSGMGPGNGGTIKVTMKADSRSKKARVIEGSDDEHSALSDLGSSPPPPASLAPPIVAMERSKRGVTVQTSPRRERKKRTTTTVAVEIQENWDVTGSAEFETTKQRTTDLKELPDVDVQEKSKTRKTPAKRQKTSSRNVTDHMEGGVLEIPAMEGKVHIISDDDDLPFEDTPAPKSRQKAKKGTAKEPIAAAEAPVKEKGKRRRTTSKGGNSKGPIESQAQKPPAKTLSKEVIDSEDDDDDDDLGIGITVNKKGTSTKTKPHVEVGHIERTGAEDGDDDDAKYASNASNTSNTGTPIDTKSKPKEPPATPQHSKSARRGPHSPINGGKPSAIKYRVGLSRRANIESLHGYLRK
ncbi:hypothetical protein DFH27DRAFT_395775 [Peziza echinospora]|nr:hypothetical protein DFH27DRAFT_395775 [Peziza echinospora]